MESYNVRDANLKVTGALPAGSATATFTAGIDVQNGPSGVMIGTVEALITSPALAVGALPDAQVITYSLQHDTDPAFGTAATIPGCSALIAQTGAGGAGDAGTTVRTRLPTNVKRYIRLKTAMTGGNTTSAASSGKLELLT